MKKFTIILLIAIFMLTFLVVLTDADAKGKMKYDTKAYEECKKVHYPSDKDYVSYPMYNTEQQARTSKVRDKIRRAKLETVTDGINDKVRKSYNHMKTFCYPTEKHIHFRANRTNTFKYIHMNQNK